MLCVKGSGEVSPRIIVEKLATADDFLSTYALVEEVDYSSDELVVETLEWLTETRGQ